MLCEALETDYAAEHAVHGAYKGGVAGLYKAPVAIIDCIEAGWTRGLDAGLQEEA